MAEEIKGEINGKGMKIALVVSRFNDFITEGLKEGALKGLKDNNVDDSDISVIYCPGSFEIPVVARACVSGGKFHAVICLGAVIRGETDHYDYVCQGVTNGISRVSLESPVPVLFGVLTCQNVELAMERAGQGKNNKGYETALAALEMINILKKTG
jgi:6,7-dimethyl-8-ribityllumazine synthase